MKQNKKLLAILGGAACAALTAAAVYYDLTYNAGKLVYPMDSYAFEPTDIPMTAALILDFLYLMILLGSLVRSVSAERKRAENANRTRKLNPKLGFLGFFGFFGFAGLWSYQVLGDLSAFVFFTFFGFFGFFFEGKMSNTLMDERFKENAARAELKAYRTGFTVIFLLLSLSAQAARFKASLLAPILISGTALAVALTMFLSEYLLYRYDHDDAAALEDE